jgi:hypothetical protein
MKRISHRGTTTPIITAPAIPTPADGIGKTIVVTRTPAGAMRLKYEDISGVATRRSAGKGTRVLRLPVAAPLGRVHRARRGQGLTRRSNR